MESKVLVDNNLCRRLIQLRIIVVKDLYRRLMTEVLIVNHRYRYFMPKIIVVALVWALMLSAWGVARAEENTAPAVQAGGSQAQGTPATGLPSASPPPTSSQPTAAQPAVASDEVVFREDEWVAFLNLPADQEAALKRALAVKHRHMSELANIPGVWLVWVDADKGQPPIIRVDVNEETPEMDRLVPAEIEGVPVEVVKADQWFLMEPPYSAPTNFREGAPLAEAPLNGIQAGGQGGVSNSRIDPASSLSAWSKIGPVEAARNCERGRAFLIWLATDPRFIAHYTRVVQQQRGANWFYDQSKMVEMYRDGVCVAASDPRLAGK